MVVDFEMVTTKGGDKGETSLYNGERRFKDDLIFNTLGDLDELNSYLGLIKVLLIRKPFWGLGKWFHKKEILWLETIQRLLFNVGSDIATPSQSDLFQQLNHPLETDLNFIEMAQKEVMNQIHLPKAFIIPGTTYLSSHMDVCRTICRRLERKLVTCIREHSMNHLSISLTYVNRLSDFLFVLARYFEKGLTVKK